MHITALAGGIGGARFLRGLLHHLDRLDQASPTTGSGTGAGSGSGTARHEVTVIGNTADDVTLHGLRISPDLDTVMYTLGGGIHEEQGWGRADETFSVAHELAAYGAEPQWFTLGDRDVATHLVRTRMLGLGYSLSQVTEALCARWQPGVRLLPMSDDPIETHVVIDDPEEPGGVKAVHFQEWWIRLHAAVPARQILAVGIEQAKPAPGVLEAIRDADVVLLPPSNPVVSIGTILAVPGVRDAIRATSAPVVGVSPIIGGAPVRGMADACLTAIGLETSAAAVADLYRDFLGGWLVAEDDAASPVPEGVRLRAVPLLMSDVEAAADIAAAALDLALELEVLRMEILGLTGIGEVRAGDDLAELILDALSKGLPLAEAPSEATGTSGSTATPVLGGAASSTGDRRLRDGDVLVVSSKVVSKAEGRVVAAQTRDAQIEAETVRRVAARRTPRGLAQIVQAAAGPVMAAAGVDASNVAPGTVLLLPKDPDASARALRARLRELTGVRLGVILSDTAGRAWRDGQTDFALGAAGVAITDDLRGALDTHGQSLEVTVRALADELAAAADLVKGKLTAVPVALIRGSGVPVTVEDGPGAAVLLRRPRDDWFRHGHVESVRRSLAVPLDAVDPPGIPVDDVPARLARVLAVAAAGQVQRGGLSFDAPRAFTSRTTLQSQDGDTAWITLGTEEPTPEFWLNLGALAQRLSAAAWSEDLAVQVTPTLSDSTPGLQVTATALPEPVPDTDLA